MQRLGVVFPDRSRPLSSQRQRVESLAELGYTDLWAGESDGADAFVALGVAAGWGTSLRLGTAVVSAFLHPPASLAMRAATLADAAQGGVVLGIGASSAAIVQRWNGLPYEQPLTRVRETADFVRTALAGTRQRGFTLYNPPPTPVPIFVGALRPSMMRVARDHGDGVILTCIGADDMAAIRPHVAPDHETVAWITVCPSTDAARVRAVARRRLAGYLASPAYEAQQRWLGRGDALEPMWAAWRAGEGLAAAADAIPDAVIDALVVHGDADVCRAHVQRFIDGGVTMPLFEVLPDVMDVDEALALMAPDAAPPRPASKSKRSS